MKKDIEMLIKARNNFAKSRQKMFDALHSVMREDMNKEAKMSFEKDAVPFNGGYVEYISYDPIFDMCFISVRQNNKKKGMYDIECDDYDIVSLLKGIENELNKQYMLPILKQMETVNGNK